MSAYLNNLEKANSLVTRNADNIQTITNPSFWINDEKQEDDSNEIIVSQSSLLNYLKIKQQQGHLCTIFPVDGQKGVFRKVGLPIKNNRSFVYDWQTEMGIESRNAGDCDCLILDEKWRLLEFKTASFSEDIKQINNNRNKAEAQLARGLTSFKEQLEEPSLKFECVVVVPSFFSFPKFKSSFSRKIRFQKLYQVELKEISTAGNESYDLGNI